jgi:F420-dependent oxidoreductase-like protein
MTLEVHLMIEGQEDVTWAQWLAIAATAEQSGFSGLFRSDHYMSERIGSKRSSLEAWGTICGLAAVTSHIKLGTLVSPVGFRHPSALAKLVVTADQVSGGRVELGMGTGWFEDEHLAYGFPFPARGVRTALLEEQVEIVKRAWGAEPFSFAGEHYQIANLDAWPKPVQQPSPRLIVGGDGGPRTIALAARWADEYNSSDPTDEQIRERTGKLHDACEQVGRDPQTVQFSIVTGILVGSDRAELEQRAVRVAQNLGDNSPDAATSLRSLPETWIVGTPAAAVERLEVLASLGVNRAIVLSPLHDDLDMIALIGREILPRFHDR